MLGCGKRHTEDTHVTDTEIVTDTTANGSSLTCGRHSAVHHSIYLNMWRLVILLLLLLLLVHMVDHFLLLLLLLASHEHVLLLSCLLLLLGVDAVSLVNALIILVKRIVRWIHFVGSDYEFDFFGIEAGLDYSLDLIMSLSRERDSIPLQNLVPFTDFAE